ncbi:LiaF domain-containing protein [Limibacter armeniacum]|uniref:DUF1707 SHOCT-like domain-containing protein n=1 Tax=Limibacter armeniacum TaxID=466084 RepID=UPI002FE538E5
MLQKTTFGLPKKREQVIQALQDAFTQHELEETDYENRLQMAYEAKSVEDLSKILHDFPSHLQPFQAKTNNVNASSQQLPKFQNLPPNKISTIMGELKTDISQNRGEVVKVVTTLGENNVSFRNLATEVTMLFVKVESRLGTTRLDLRNEDFKDKILILDMDNILGEVVIHVPYGTAIKKEMSTALGQYRESDKGNKWYKKLLKTGTSNSSERKPIENFRLLIKGTTFLGNVQVNFH